MIPTLAELCERANVTKIHPAPVPSPDALVDLAKGLLEMRRAGVLGAVYCDDGKFWICLPGESLQHRMGVQTVARIVQKYRECLRKGVALEFRTAEKRKTA
jgi:hypothetical protein